MRVCASPLRFTVPSQLRAKRTLRNNAFSVTHVTAHGRGQDPLPPLGSALHCSAPQVSTTLYLRYSFCIVFHAPSTYTHNIYIYFILISVIRHLYYTDYTDATCMVCTEPLAAAPPRDTNELLLTAVCSVRRNMSRTAKLSHINNLDILFLRWLDFLTH